MVEMERRLSEGVFDDKEEMNRKDKTLEFKKGLYLFKSGTEFEQDIMEGVEEVRDCVDLENDGSCLDTEDTDIKKLISNKEYVESFSNHNYPRNRKESRETLDLRYNCE